jgi:HK97 family phage prohead protease
MAHSGLSECAIFVAYRMSKITKTFNVKIVNHKKDGGRILITTPAVDRDKDRVLPQGVKIDNYLKNPVVQWGHDYSSPYSTIGRTTNIEVTPEGVVADFELRPAVNDQDPQNVVRLLWEGGWVKAASIGFIPLKGTKNAEGGSDYTESELLEWSLVSIPANQTALALAVKGLSMKKNTKVKSPDYRLPDETEDACNARKFAELVESGMSEDEARAMAAEMCAQEAPAEDAPADEPTPEEQASAKGEGDMLAALDELAALVDRMRGMLSPDAPAEDTPADEPMQESAKGVTKRGRVLSAGNESKLRTAYDSIGEVLAQIGDAPDEGKDAESQVLKELAAALGDLPKLFKK